MKLLILDILIVLRLLSNDGIMLENRRPIPKRQPPEVIRFVRRPARRGRKKSLQFDATMLNSKDLFKVIPNDLNTIQGKAQRR
jgi:hypothetical protein